MNAAQRCWWCPKYRPSGCS